MFLKIIFVKYFNRNAKNMSKFKSFEVIDKFSYLHKNLVIDISLYIYKIHEHEYLIRKLIFQLNSKKKSASEY